MLVYNALSEAHMVAEADLELYIRHGKEERYLEYKCAMIWTGNATTKVKVAKAMMAMANLRNGGIIVIGMKEISRGVWVPDCMSVEQATSFSQDDIATWVNDYAFPAVQFTVEPYVLDKNQFVVIQVREFDYVPTICRKQKRSGGEVLEPGAIYYRSRLKNESAPIASEEDMRELITLAVNKGVAQEVNRLRELGLVAPVVEPQRLDMLKYREEREDL